MQDWEGDGERAFFNLNFCLQNKVGKKYVLSCYNDIRIKVKPITVIYKVFPLTE
jgi:hypothetical protein